MTARVLVGCGPAIAAAFDFGFLALAGPRLANEAGAGGVYAWLFSAASLAYGAAVMPASWLAKQVPQQLVLAGGIGLSAIGTALLAVAGAADIAIVGRVLFGLGGGTAAAPALDALGGTGTARMRRLAFAALGAGGALGFSAGVVAAALAEWRIVLAVVALLLGALATLALALPRAGSARSAAAPITCAPRRRTPSLRLAASVAGAATTASGVGATVLIGRYAARPGGVPELALCAFGMTALPAAALARRLAARSGPTAAAARGLTIQAVALLAVAGVLAGGASNATFIIAIAIFGAGHVIANAGVAATVAEPAGPSGGVLVTAQYIGAGAGPPLVLSAAAFGDAAGMALAAAIACIGAMLVAAPIRRRPPAGQRARHA